MTSQDEQQRNSVDFHAVLRSVVRQRRATELRHGQPGPMLDIETPQWMPATEPTRYKEAG